MPRVKSIAMAFQNAVKMKLFSTNQTVNGVPRKWREIKYVSSDDSSNEMIFHKKDTEWVAKKHEEEYGYSNGSFIWKILHK